jgi:hypothetical protein
MAPTSKGKMGVCCFIRPTKPCPGVFWHYSTNKNTALGDQPPHSPPAPTADDESKLPPPMTDRRRSLASSPYTRIIDAGSKYSVGGGVVGIIAAAAGPPRDVDDADDAAHDGQWRLRRVVRGGEGGCGLPIIGPI